jgi:hypothetical protein
MYAAHSLVTTHTCRQAHVLQWKHIRHAYEPISISYALAIWAYPSSRVCSNLTAMAVRQHEHYCMTTKDTECINAPIKASLRALLPSIIR